MFLVAWDEDTGFDHTRADTHSAANGGPFPKQVYPEEIEPCG